VSAPTLSVESEKNDEVRRVKEKRKKKTKKGRGERK
jgi:hypothetical protein